MSVAYITRAWAIAMPPTRKLVLIALADMADETGRCYALVSTLMARTGLAERTVRRDLKDLEESGCCRRIFRSGHSSVFRLELRESVETTPALHAPTPALHAPTPALHAPTPALHAPTPALHAPTPALHAPITVSEPSTEPSCEPPPTPASQKAATRGASNGAGLDQRFGEFWAAWPRKQSKVDAWRAWKRLKPDGELLATMLAAVARQRLSVEWQRDGGKYIPHPATWLNGRRWEDEVTLAPTGYAPDELAVFDAYDAALAAQGWPEALTTPYSATRAAAIREFLGFNSRPGWVEKYFAWLSGKLPPLEGLGFDWVIRRETYLRAKEGNFAALRDAA